MKIDYRSDTVTRPSTPMLDVMRYASVGDAVFGDDPSVLELESFAADMFGMDRGLFCPSGTMANQIAIKVHTKPGDQLICDQTAHVYFYEGGGAALHSGVTCRLLSGDGGRFQAAEVEAVINDPEDTHFPRTRVVSIENTCNKGGGTCWDFREIERIGAVCKSHDLSLHLDGARLFHALIETPESPADYGSLFDSISICLSKGLGAPMGSLLLGSEEFIHEASRARKAFGGGMRQAGYMAAAGLFALQNNTRRLTIDHEKARRLSEAFERSGLAGEVLPAVTNIVMFDFETPEALDAAKDRFAAADILVAAMGKKRLRLVTHLDITEEMIDRTIKIIEGMGDD
ncbi:MAG: GntG family PLP-dependent aldolase [Acidobacteriota bacterium]